MPYHFAPFARRDPLRPPGSSTLELRTTASPPPGRRTPGSIRLERLSRRLGCALLFAAVLAGCETDPMTDPLTEPMAAEIHRDFSRPGDPNKTVCAGSSTLQGIDVSSWQGSIDWYQVAASGRAFAIARIGDGYYIDSYFQYNWAQIKAAGMIRGAYQFFRAGEDPYAQAQIVIDAVGWLGDGDLPVTLDIEDEGVSGVSTSTVVANMNAWLAAVEAGTGKRPMIYTGYYVFDDYEGYGDYSSYPLWIAAWYVSCPSINNEWSTWTFWQYSSTGSVPGIYGAVDLDVFNGGWDALYALAGAGSSASRNVTVAGNWDGYGADSVGLFDNSSALWSLNNAVDGSTLGYQFGWGPHGDPDALPIAGDWNGDKISSVGLWYRDTATWTMTNYTMESGVDYSFSWGALNDPNANPITGDWNGDGIDTAGVWNRDTAIWTMTDYNMESGVDHQFGWGPLGNVYAVPIVGDWNGDGIDTPGLWYRDSGTWSMTDYNMESGVNYWFQWGPINDPNVVPVIGDWNGDGIDTAGLYNPTTGEWGMTDYNMSSGVDHAFTWTGTITGAPNPDADGDGWTQSSDCNDSNGAIHPGASESCNGVDEDCDGVVDEDATDASLWYQDADGDGYGNPDVGVWSCTQPAGYVSGDLEADCDDNTASASPAMDELPEDGIDNDCDGQVDETSGGCGAARPVRNAPFLPASFAPLLLVLHLRRRR